MYGVSDSTVLALLKGVGVELDRSRQAVVRQARTDEMRQLEDAGYTLKEIGERYGITRQAVSMRLTRNATRATEAGEGASM